MHKQVRDLKECQSIYELVRTLFIWQYRQKSNAKKNTKKTLFNW